MAYALSTIWYERNRFLPAILAVAFSAILITVQGGLTIGLLSMMSSPVDRSEADVWVGYPGMQSVDVSEPIPQRWNYRLASDPGVDIVEEYVIGFSIWRRLSDDENKPPIQEICTVVGSELSPNSIGAVQYLRDNPHLLEMLNEPFTIIVDESELKRLGITKMGDKAEVLGRRVRVVGTVKGYKSLAGPYIFCSIDTAKQFLKYRNDQVTYFLGRCKTGVYPHDVKDRMGRYRQLSTLTSEEFSQRSRIHWLTTTKAGLAVGFTSLLGLLVGAVVTSQTLFAATVASQRELATMRAMGIPTWRLQFTVVSQAMWVGVLGIVVAIPLTIILAAIAGQLGTQVILHPLIISIAVIVTLLMAVGSGLAALRSFQGVDPAHNIR
jgi:putative ABC transport system permease protein